MPSSKPKIKKQVLKKKKQLGIHPSTAQNKLRKAVSFRLCQEAGRDTCFRCGKVIETVKEFSIDHMVDWLDSGRPKELFFDVDNIAFSHRKCNIGNSRSALGSPGRKFREFILSPTIPQREIPKIKNKIKNGKTQTEIAKEYRVSRRTIYRALKR